MKVQKNHIDKLLSNSEIKVQSVYGRVTIVSCKLPNGFIITESSACVDPINYDEDLGTTIALRKIKDKIWEFEGYLLQQRAYEESSIKE